MCRKCELLKTLDYSEPMDAELFEVLNEQLMSMVKSIEKADPTIEKMSEKRKINYHMFKMASSLITSSFFCDNPVNWDQETIWAAQLLAGEVAVANDAGVHEERRLNSIAKPAINYIFVIAGRADKLRALKLEISPGEFTPEKVAKIKLKQLGDRRKPIKDCFDTFVNTPEYLNRQN